MAGLSILRVVSNSELIKQEKARIDKEVQDRQNSSLILGISSYLRECWDAAKIAKQPLELKMLKAMRQRNGEYEADKLAAIQTQGGSEVYMMITEVKCRAAESWLRDILLDTGTPPWDIKPTPLPELSPVQAKEIESIFADTVMEILKSEDRAPTRDEVSQLKEMVAQDYRFRVLHEAQTRADKMNLKISDQFAEGGWSEAFNDFITDLVTYPCAFIKGPVVRRQRVLGWTQDEFGKTVAAPTERIAPEYERVDPFRIFPEPGISNLNDGYIFEHHRLTRMDLADLIGVPGYDDNSIKAALENGNASSWVNVSFEFQKEQEEHKFNTTLRPTEMFDALEFWGKVSGQMLLDWGLTEEDVPDESKEYDANVWVVGNHVIKAVLNYDPLGEKPYAKTSFIKCPGAFWGKGIPEIIEDIQNVCNAAARALVNNMGISSGPQVEVNVDRLPPNEDITQIHPWKIWQVLNDPVGSSAPAVRFSQPEDNANTLVAVYDKFSRLADEHSGIPAYLYGDLNVQGAGRTSSGLSMLMGSAGKGIRQVVMHIDSDIVKPIVKRQYIYNMRYDSDESIKGDVVILPRGAINLASKETMNVRRLEFLNATSNPVDMEIIGKDGRAAIIREVSRSLQMPMDEIVPSSEKMDYNDRMKAKVAIAQASQPEQQAGISAPKTTPTQPDGSPKGGMDANLVANRAVGVNR